MGVELLVEPEGSDQGGGVSEAVGFDENEVDLVIFIKKGVKGGDEVVLHSAADTAVGHLVEVIDDIALSVCHELRLDSHGFCELVLNNGHFRVQGRRLHNVLDERGFPRPEEPCQDNHLHFISFLHYN